MTHGIHLEEQKRAISHTFMRDLNHLKKIILENFLIMRHDLALRRDGLKISEKIS